MKSLLSHEQKHWTTSRLIPILKQSLEAFSDSDASWRTIWENIVPAFFQLPLSPCIDDPVWKFPTIEPSMTEPFCNFPHFSLVGQLGRINHGVFPVSTWYPPLFDPFPPLVTLWTSILFPLVQANRTRKIEEQTMLCLTFLYQKQRLQLCCRTTRDI